MRKQQRLIVRDSNTIYLFAAFRCNSATYMVQSSNTPHSTVNQVGTTIVRIYPSRITLASSKAGKLSMLLECVEELCAYCLLRHSTVLESIG